MSLSQQSVNNCSFLPKATDLPPASCFNLKELVGFAASVVRDPNLQKSAIPLTEESQQIKMSCKEGERVSRTASGRMHSNQTNSSFLSSPFHKKNRQRFIAEAKKHHYEPPLSRQRLSGSVFIIAGCPSIFVTLGSTNDAMVLATNAS